MNVTSFRYVTGGREGIVIGAGEGLWSGGVTDGAMVGPDKNEVRFFVAGQENDFRSANGVHFFCYSNSLYH